MQNLDNPQGIAPIPKDTKEIWPSMDGNNPKKMTGQGREDPVES